MWPESYIYLIGPGNQPQLAKMKSAAESSSHKTTPPAVHSPGKSSPLRDRAISDAEEDPASEFYPEPAQDSAAQRRILLLRIGLALGIMILLILLATGGYFLLNPGDSLSPGPVKGGGVPGSHAKDPWHSFGGFSSVSTLIRTQSPAVLIGAAVVVLTLLGLLITVLVVVLRTRPPTPEPKPEPEPTVLERTMAWMKTPIGIVSLLAGLCALLIIGIVIVMRGRSSSPGRPPVVAVPPLLDPEQEYVQLVDIIANYAPRLKDVCKQLKTNNKALFGGSTKTPVLFSDGVQHLLDIDRNRNLFDNQLLNMNQQVNDFVALLVYGDEAFDEAAIENRQLAALYLDQATLHTAFPDASEDNIAELRCIANHLASFLKYARSKKFIK